MIELAVIVIGFVTEVMVLHEPKRHVLEAYPVSLMTHFNGVVNGAMGVVARRWPCHNNDVATVETVAGYTYIFAFGPVGATIICCFMGAREPVVAKSIEYRVASWTKAGSTADTGA